MKNRQDGTGLPDHSGTVPDWLTPAVILLTAMLAAGCADGQPVGATAELAAGHAAPQTAPAAAPQPQDLELLLAKELAWLGIDPARPISAAPTGEDSAVFDLRAEIADADWPNSELPVSIELSWTERLAGDYNQDGQVGVSDLTPLAHFWQNEITYDDPALHDGFAHWPSGDPDGAGAANWRAARVDGNGDGRIDLSDIPTIAQHWGESLSGYRVYWHAPGEAGFTLLPNPGDETSPLTIARGAAFPLGSVSPDPARPVRYRLLLDGAAEGSYAFYVEPYDLDSRQAGPAGNIAELAVLHNQPPVAALTASPNAGDPPLTVTLDASASIDPDGQIAVYEWDFDGDGEYDQTTGVHAAVAHTYDAHGTQVAAVRVTDDEGATAVATASIQLTENVPPLAVIRTPFRQGAAPLVVTVESWVSEDPDGTIVWREMDWQGDGVYDTSAASDVDLIHTYVLTGVYHAQLRVTDDDGAASTGQIEVSVNPPPAAEISLGPQAGPAPLSVVILAGGQDAHSSITKLEWDWEGDGVYDYEDQGPDGYAPEQHDPWHRGAAVHDYSQPGAYRPTVRVTNSRGISATASALLVVEPAVGEPRWRPGFPAGYAGTSTVAMALVGGRPAIAYVEDGGTDVLMYVRALDEEGEHWAAPTVAAQSPDSIYYYDSGLMLAEIAGVPAVCYYGPGVEDGPAELTFCRALNAEGTSWAAPVTLASPEYSGSLWIACWHSLAEIGGHPAVCYSFERQDGLYYRRAQDPAGAGWGPQVGAAPMHTTPRDLSLAAVDGRPAIAFYCGALYYLRAGDAVGEAWNSAQALAHLGGQQACLMIADGNPAIAYAHRVPQGTPTEYVNFIRAGDPQGAGWGLPVVVAEGKRSWAGPLPSATIIDGVPAVTCTIEGRQMYIAALDPAGAAWDSGQALQLVFGGENRASLVRLAGGGPAVCYEYVPVFAAFY